ncbi:hypothetical protein B1748_14730 [Paenibacillus sp. MY03]|uniref:DUF5696 domain-containing protein n=1 Tax=Paenibacillus sp. MY03 TaxID=302980 RepID=UPI000B3CF93C|nr:DUF5696 domain-containing protein [Paenibacillus sp. MY03]OUS76063.1 hypothetical protein B1748_14730 [Paenibacillus sp. MY03]
MPNIKAIADPGRRKTWLFGGLALAIIVVGLAIWSLSSPGISSELDIPAYEASAMADPSGPPWLSDKRDAAGFASAARTDRLELLVNPASGQVIVQELRSGVQWRSNPTTVQLESQTVGGILRTNLESPFILEYAEQNKAQRLVVNGKDPGVKLSFSATDNGVAANYEFEKLGFRFSLVYGLTDNGFHVAIPAASITESGPFRILSIDPLPFFGAAEDDTAEPGYMFVPDGPGALIRYPQQQKRVGAGYYQYVYGPELTNKSFDPVTVSMPVFGIKKGEQAFLAVITEGEKASAIRALTPGLVSTFNSVNTRFIYREEYNRRLNLGGRAIRVFQNELLREDRQIQYYFMEKDEADYSGMARRYRKHLLDTGGLGPALAPSSHIPMHLTLVGGDTIYYGDSQYEIATTFAQGEEILRELKDAGVHELRITWQNWQHKGTLAPDLRLNVERKLGGKPGLQSFIDAAHGLGFKVYLNAVLTHADSEGSELPPKTYGIRSVEGDTLFDYEFFFLNPNITYNYAQELISEAAVLRADGIHYSGIGETVFRDYNPRFAYTRNDTAYLYNRILEQTQGTLGAGSAYLGNAYALRYLSDIQQFPGETHQYYAIDETVPFYPMAVHGHITYSMVPGNLRSQYDDEFLRAIEYGAVPSFILTAESSRTLMQTKTWGLFTSQFSQWKEKASAEYESFNRLASLHHLQMIGHSKRTEGVYETEYADGTVVVVDYNEKTFRVERGGGT